jgi:hypothetical protein
VRMRGIVAGMGPEGPNGNAHMTEGYASFG